MSGGQARVLQDGRSKKRPGPDTQKTIIVAAAVDLFVERGSAGVSISDICARADIGRQTFYRCFEDKEALVAHLYQHAVNEHIEKAIGRMPASHASGEWAYDVINHVIDSILENPRLAQFLYIEASNPTSPAFAIVDSAMDRAARNIQRWFAAQVGARPSRVHVKAVFAATTWLVHNAVIAGKTKASVAEAKRASRLLFEGMFRSLQATQKR